MFFTSRWQAHRQFIKFLLVGLLNTVFGYGVYALFLWLGFHYSVASALAIALGVLFNFQTIRTLVFQAEPSRGRLLKFSAVYAVVYLLQISGIAALNRAGFGDYSAGAILVLPLAGVAFLLNQKLVFKQ